MRRRALATPWCALQNIVLIDPEKRIITNKASADTLLAFARSARCRSLKPSQYRNDNHIHGIQCRVAAMSFWLQVVYTTLLSLTPLDMWGFIANCTSQAGIPSSSMAVRLIVASTLLGLLVPMGRTNWACCLFFCLGWAHSPLFADCWDIPILT